MIEDTQNNNEPALPCAELDPFASLGQYFKAHLAEDIHDFFVRAEKGEEDTIVFDILPNDVQSKPRQFIVGTRDELSRRVENVELMKRDASEADSQDLA